MRKSRYAPKPGANSSSSFSTTRRRTNLPGTVTCAKNSPSLLPFAEKTGEVSKTGVGGVTNLLEDAQAESEVRKVEHSLYRRDSMESPSELQVPARVQNLDNGFSFDGARSEVGIKVAPAVNGSANETIIKKLPPHLRARAQANTEKPLPKTPFTEASVKAETPLPEKRPIASEKILPERPLPPHLRGRAQEATEVPKREESPATNTTRHTATASETPTIDADRRVRSVEDTFVEVVGWQPLYIKSLDKVPGDNLATIPALRETVAFSWDFLKNTLGGLEWSPGVYYAPTTHGPSVLPNRTYCAFDATYEPYLPMCPGMHGAKLTVFFNDNPDDEEGEVGEAAYENFPMFVQASRFARKCEASPDKYIYFGTYSQSRWSDRLDYDHMMNDVPDDVKMHWATQLSDSGRPEWVTDKLARHFWPPPEYMGALPERLPATGSEVGGPDEDDEHGQKVQHDVCEYIKELRTWKIETPIKTALLGSDTILEAFGRPDAADPPGLRLQWEYLECVGYDREFYDHLCRKMKERK